MSSKKRLAEMAEYMEACALIARNGADIHNGSKELREHADMVTAIASYLSSAVETPPHHKWPGEPPHCPSCACGAPETPAEPAFDVEEVDFIWNEMYSAIAGGATDPMFQRIEDKAMAIKRTHNAKRRAQKASEPQCICATTAEPLRHVDPQCPKHSTRS
jgi:hypothetical protein